MYKPVLIMAMVMAAVTPVSVQAKIDLNQEDTAYFAPFCAAAYKRLMREAAADTPEKDKAIHGLARSYEVYKSVNGNNDLDLLTQVGVAERDLDAFLARQPITLNAFGAWCDAWLEA